MFFYLIKTVRNYCLFTVISQGTLHVMAYYLLNLFNNVKEDSKGLDGQSSVATAETTYQWSYRGRERCGVRRGGQGRCERGTRVV